MEEYTTVDLFCGAGGFSEGFRKAGGFKTLLAVDFDKQATETFKYNHPEVRTVCRDVSDISSVELKELTGGGKVDVVVGGPPCQGFSLAGRRLPDDPKNKLFREFVRIVDVLQPKVFVFENVAGIKSMQGGKILDAICEEFEAIGYNLNHDILNSAAYGVPQARPRFIMIGVKRGINNPEGLPSPTHGLLNEAEPELFNSGLKPFVTVAEALSNLPILFQGEGEEVTEALEAKNSYQKSVSGDRQRWELYNHRATRHSELVVKRYSAMPQGGDIRSLPTDLRTKKNNVFRLLESAPARTITCNFRTDILHPWQPRGLTTREAARLQSFDDDYQFFGNLTRKAKYLTQDDQVGNAVPPLLAKAIANFIKKIL